MGENVLVLIPEHITAELTEYFQEIGYSNEDKKKIFLNLQDKLRFVCEDSIDSVKKDKEMFEESVSDTIDKISEIRDRLGMPLDDEMVEKLIGKSLIERFDYLNKKLEALVPKKEEATAKMQSHISAVEDVINELGIPEGDRKECFIDDYDLSNRRYDMLGQYLEELLSQKMELAGVIQKERESIMELWSELEVAAASDFEKSVLYGTGMKTSFAFLRELKDYKGGLVLIKQRKRENLDNLIEEVAKLWEQLNIPDADREYFLENCTGLAEGEEMCKCEIDKLDELKKERLGELIVYYKKKLNEVWNKLHIGPDERERFLRGISLDMTEENLYELYESEVDLLEKLYKVQQPIWSAIELFEGMVTEKVEFEESTRRKSRLLQKKGGDPGRLLREEKLRKKFQIELPKARNALVHTLKEYGRPVFYDGEDYLKVRLKRRLAEASLSHDSENSRKPGVNTLFTSAASGKYAATPKPARPNHPKFKANTLATPMLTPYQATPRPNRKTPAYKLRRRNI